MLSSPTLVKASQERAVKVFKKLASRISFYKKYLKELNVDPAEIKDFKAFERYVPILDKEKLFTENISNVREILVDGKYDDFASVLPSSGYSGKFSFGVTTKADHRSQAKEIDLALDYVFNVGRRKTLLINSLCMGINIPATMVVLANTGPRMDIVISLIQTFSRDFDQTIIVGDNSLIKNIIEKGIEDGIKWADYKIHLILGGDSFPENFRSYLAHLMDIDIEHGQRIVLGSSFGIAEIGLNILLETYNTIGIRRAASLDTKFRKELLAQEEKLCPMLFQYHPLRIYVEEVLGRLLFTNLNMDARVPIIRYASGDMGIIIPYERIAKTLKQVGLQRFTPNPPLPIVAVKERLQYLNFDGCLIFPNVIKNALYSDFALPRLTTGYFRIAKSNKKLLLEIQLKQNVAVSDEIRERFEVAIASYVRDVRFELKFYPYREFQYGMGLDYERKFQYMCQCHA